MLPHPIMYLEWYFSLPIEFPTFSLTTNLNCVRSESLTWIVWNVAGAEEIVSFEKVWTRLEQKVLAAKGKSSVCMHVFLWTKYWAIPGLFFFIFGLFNTDSKQLIVNKICQWQDSNCRFLVSVETALPTEAQPRPLLLFIFVFSTDNRKFVHSKNLPMTGFKPHTFGIGSDRSINWATNQASFLFISVKKWEGLNRAKSKLGKYDTKWMRAMSVVVAQLVERSLQIPKVSGSNPVIGKFYYEHIYCKLLKRRK